MKFKHTVLFIALLSASFTASAKEKSVIKQPQPVTAIGTGEMFKHIDMKKVGVDLNRRSELQIERDLLGNETAAIQARMEAMRNKSEQERLEYIRENVPIEVRVLGIEQSTIWLQTEYQEQVDGFKKSVIWTSSENNIFVPEMDNAKLSPTENSPIQAISSLELDKLRELNGLVNIDPDIEADLNYKQPPAPLIIEQPVSLSIDRQFIVPTTVNAKKVVLFGKNKKFTGDISFKITLKNGQESITSNFDNLKIGDQFSMQGNKFVLGDISNTRLTLINMENSESHYLKY